MKCCTCIHVNFTYYHFFFNFTKINQRVILHEKKKPCEMIFTWTSHVPILPGCVHFLLPVINYQTHHSWLAGCRHRASQCQGQEWVTLVDPAFLDHTELSSLPRGSCWLCPPELYLERKNKKKIKSWQSFKIFSNNYMHLGFNFFLGGLVFQIHSYQYNLFKLT